MLKSKQTIAKIICKLASTATTANTGHLIVVNTKSVLMFSATAKLTSLLQLSMMALSFRVTYDNFTFRLNVTVYELLTKYEITSLRIKTTKI